MRFLMLNWRDPRNPKAGGAERVSMAYMSALARRGHEVCWFSHSFAGGARQEELDGVRIVREGGFATSVVEAIAWYRSQPRFDLVIDQHHGIPWYAPWWCDTRCIGYIHEVLGPIWESFYPWPLSWVGQTQERWTHRLYHRVPFWTVCEFTRRLLREQGVQDVKVISNGIDTRALPTLEGKSLREPLLLATVSRMAPNKRVDHALQVLQILTQRGIDARLRIVGTGDLDNPLRQYAAELGVAGQAIFTGALPEDAKNLILREAHFLIHTSLREGWGLNVIEANAMGTPAVVYPVAGLTESTVPGVTGIVTPTESPEAMAQCLSDALQAPDQYQELRQNAWERARELHWDKVLPPACDWLEEQASIGRSTQNKK